MANISRIEAGAGEGNRTPVVSLGSLCSRGFLRFFRLNQGEQKRAKACRFREQVAYLPQVYRTRNGPESACAAEPALTTRRDVRHG